MRHVISTFTDNRGAKWRIGGKTDIDIKFKNHAEAIKFFVKMQKHLAPNTYAYLKTINEDENPQAA